MSATASKGEVDAATCVTLILFSTETVWPFSALDYHAVFLSQMYVVVNESMVNDEYMLHL